MASLQIKSRAAVTDDHKCIYHTENVEIQVLRSTCTEYNILSVSWRGPEILGSVPVGSQPLVFPLHNLLEIYSYVGVAVSAPRLLVRLRLRRPPPLDAFSVWIPTYMSFSSFR